MLVCKVPGGFGPLGKVKQAAIKVCKRLYYTERGFERWLRRKAGVAVPQDVEEARKPAPYVHPWTLEDPRPPLGGE